jgi:hypothetical protein
LAASQGIGHCLFVGHIPVEDRQPVAGCERVPAADEGSHLVTTIQGAARDQLPDLSRGPEDCDFDRVRTGHIHGYPFVILIVSASATAQLRLSSNLGGAFI